MYKESGIYCYRNKVNGKLYVGGPFDAIEIWGKAYARDAMLSIDFLKSEFYFEDSVTIHKDAFVLKDMPFLGWLKE